jgi:hypothetical protein
MTPANCQHYWKFKIFTGIMETTWTTANSGILKGKAGIEFHRHSWILNWKI